MHKARVLKMYLQLPPLLRPGFCRRGHKEPTACDLLPGSVWQAYTSALSRHSALSFPRRHRVYLDEYFRNSTILDHNVITIREGPNTSLTFMRIRFYITLFCFGHSALVIQCFFFMFFHGFCTNYWGYPWTILPPLLCAYGTQVIPWIFRHEFGLQFQITTVLWYFSEIQKSFVEVD